MSHRDLNKPYAPPPPPPTPQGPQQPQNFLDWIKQHPKPAAGIGAVALILAIGIAAGAGKQPANTPVVPVAAPSTAGGQALPAPASATPAAGAAKTAALPSFIGMGLQSAQDKAQAAGFFILKSHDALGRSRMQIDDRNWKVCTQTPTAGEQQTGVTVEFGTVKLDEECPAQDQGASTPKAGSTMPDVRGKAVAAVRDTLDKSTSFQIKDVGQGRLVIVESDWQVCSQDPAPGTALNGQPVSLKVVKFGETCP